MERTTGVAGVLGVLEPEPPAAAPSGPSRPSMVWYFLCRDMAYTDMIGFKVYRSCSTNLTNVINSFKCHV